jgi:hypothetical protein
LHLGQVGRAVARGDEDAPTPDAAPPRLDEGEVGLALFPAVVVRNAMEGFHGDGNLSDKQIADPATRFVGDQLMLIPDY